MDDPVDMPDGVTYDRAWIRKILAERGGQFNGRRMTMADARPNAGIKRRIDDWKLKHGTGVETAMYWALQLSDGQGRRLTFVVSPEITVGELLGQYRREAPDTGSQARTASYLRFRRRQLDLARQIKSYPEIHNNSELRVMFMLKSG
jgi:hypothetical protein